MKPDGRGKRSCPYPSPPCWRNHRTENGPSNISPDATRSRSPSSNAMVFAAFHVGKIAGTVAGGWWLATQDAARVAARARRLAGISPEPAIAAVQRSATALGATLTPDDVAIRQAGDSMKRLDATVETMRRD